MPTVEIISINATRVPDLPKYNGFAYCVETDVVSHRKLFQYELNKFVGFIVHLANKEFENRTEGWWFAEKLFDFSKDEFYETIRFRSLVIPEVIDILTKIIEASKGEIIFLTDFQMGPEQSQIVNKTLTLDEFLKLHEDGKLRFNALYRIKRV